MFIKVYILDLIKITNVLDPFYPTCYLPGEHRALRHFDP